MTHDPRLIEVRKNVLKAHDVTARFVNDFARPESL